MPTIELVEYDKATYIREMKQYLSDLKNMPIEKAQSISRVNLQKSQIIDDNDQFTERYKFSRANAFEKAYK